MNELKPCPFCGGEAELVEVKWEEWFWVYCKRCSAETDAFASKEKAIGAWNRRIDNE